MATRRGLLGEGPPTSAAPVDGQLVGWDVARGGLAEGAAGWCGLHVVYARTEGVYVKAGLPAGPGSPADRGGGSAGRPEVVPVIPGYRESVESWSEGMGDLRDQGMRAPRMVRGAGHLGTWGALRNG